MINAEGGVNGRKIKIVSLDDGYLPPKSVEVTRQLVEQEKVLALYMPLGTPTNSAVHKYLNQKKVPQLFITSGAVKWGDPKNYPVDDGLAAELPGRGRQLRQIRPAATSPTRKSASSTRTTISVRTTCGASRRRSGKQAAKMIVSEQAYETTDPTSIPQIINLKASGADTLDEHRVHQVRRHGDPQDGRPRLEAAAFPEQPGVGRVGHAGAGRLRQFDRASSPPTSSRIRRDPRWKDDKARGRLSRLAEEVPA